jgi:ribosomal protein S18 acetylase RimI-like enzyme
MKIWKAIFAKAKEKGGIWFLLKKILSFERWIIMQRDIGKPILDLKMNGSFQVRISRMEDLHLFEAMSKKVYIDLEAVQTRFRYGQTCYIALDQGRLIYFVWVSTYDVPKCLTSYFVKLKPGEVCMYHALCLPEYRGRKIHSSIMSLRLNDLQGKSFDKAYVDCRINNMPQMNTLQKHGFEIYKRVFVLTVAGIRFYFPLHKTEVK